VVAASGVPPQAVHHAAYRDHQLEPQPVGGLLQSRAEAVARGPRNRNRHPRITTSEDFSRDLFSSPEGVLMIIPPGIPGTRLTFFNHIFYTFFEYFGRGFSIQSAVRFTCSNAYHAATLPNGSLCLPD